MDICLVVTVPPDNTARSGAPDIIAASGYDTDAVAVCIIVPGSLCERDAGVRYNENSNKKYA